MGISGYGELALSKSLVAPQQDCAKKTCFLECTRRLSRTRQRTYAAL